MMQIVCKHGMTDCMNMSPGGCEFCGINTGGMPSGYLKAISNTIRTEGEAVVSMKDSERVSIEADMVNHPAHYNVNGMEVIDIIEGFELPYHLGNVVKYILRAGRKWDTVEDLKKAEWYLHRYIEKLEKEQKNGE